MRVDKGPVLSVIFLFSLYTFVEAIQGKKDVCTA